MPRAGASSSATAPVARITFFDVGEGDAILLRVGSWTGMVDGGGPDDGVGLVEALRRAGVKRIDTLVVSHPHLDHIGGLPAVLHVFPVRRAVVDERGTTSAARALLRALRQQRTRVIKLFRGAALAIGPYRARVLNPPRGGWGDTNENSVVLLLTVAGCRVLLAGDVGGPAEAAVAAAYTGPPVFLLKVAHHGSEWSTSPALLDATRPRSAVISVGPNSYGHPAPVTVARLRAHRVRVLSTWRRGDVTVTVLPSGRVRWSFARR